MTQDEIYPSDYYQTPTTLTAADYVEKLQELQKQGDNLQGLPEVIGLFSDLKDGHERAWDVMHDTPTVDRTTYRDWLAWRVMSEAIQYFSRMWRTDSLFLQYYEEYRLFVEDGIKLHLW